MVVESILPVQRSLVVTMHRTLDHHYEAANLGISNELVKARTGTQFLPLYAYRRRLTATARDLLDQFGADAPTVHTVHGERPR